ncbi:DUF4124 domain-containing protein [Ideonella sp. DXS22W]|uniref:DUF4124 domain-containing protein n=1 Tax=Pseudaquabacterium inlustre TaxID=2984192 RepID=A0ABU9CG23_9BURK
MSPARPHSRLPALLLGSLLLALATGAAQAQYKWKDSRGQMHVSDMPPPREVPDKDILQRPAPRVAPPANAGKSPAPAGTPSTDAASAPAAAPSARAPTDPELESRRKKLEQDARSQQRADEERQARQRAENCERARQSLATLQSGQRLFRVNAQGEREVLDDSARNADLQRARSVIAADCR